MAKLKAKVCASCLSPEIVDVNCVCVFENKYPIVELEFEQCDHCGRINPEPIDNDFNAQQLEDYQNKK